MAHTLIEALGGPLGWVVVSILGIIAGCLIPLAAIHYEGRKSLALLDLKRRMLERGMSADEIAVVTADGSPARGETLPVACEAVVERDGEWSPAYVLRSAPGRYFVHYIGGDVAENAWVESRRVRLPIQDEGEGASCWTARNGKPPVEAEV